MSSLTEQPEPAPTDDELSFDDLALRQGVKPIDSLSDLAEPGLWESDEEYQDFLDDLYASRRTELA